MKSIVNSRKTRVYIAVIPEGAPITEVYPTLRNDEIINTSNFGLRREKYFVWRLLEYAISDCFGIKIENVQFSKNENGRWSTGKFDFSLSHSDGVVAVAISDFAVGIDIQQISEPRSDRFAKRILSNEESEEFSELSEEKRAEYLIRKWCEKEAVFKSRNLTSFIPRETKAEGEYKVVSELLEIRNKKYILSVCASSDCLKHELIDLK